MLSEKLSWVAVMTRPRSEVSAANALRDKGVEVYLPMLQERDKRFKVNQLPEKPMFPCYLFAHINKFQIFDTRTAKGVIGIVSINHSVCEVPQRDIDNVRAFETTQRRVFIEATQRLVKGAWVTIREGEFAGMQGRLVRGCKEGNFAVGIEVMNMSFVVHIRRDELTPAAEKVEDKGIWEKQETIDKQEKL